MKKSRYTEEQIIGILKQHEAGVKTADLCREHGISDATFYNWKSKYGGLDVSEAQRLRQMEDENRAIEGAGCRPEPGPRGAEGGHSKKRLELAGLREDIAFVSTGFHLSAGLASCWAWGPPTSKKSPSLQARPRLIFAPVRRTQLTNRRAMRNGLASAILTPAHLLHSYGLGRALFSVRAAHDRYATTPDNRHVIQNRAFSLNT
jgi:putative transposase